MEFDLSSRPKAMPSSVCACSVERLLALSVSWLKYPIENSSNHVLDLGLELCTSSNGFVSLRPSWPGTGFTIITACSTSKYQNFWPTCFSVTNAHAICIIVRQVSFANPFEDWRPAEAAIMFESFESIHWREFPPINFLSKSEWNQLGSHPASALNNSSADVINVDDYKGQTYKTWSSTLVIRTFLSFELANILKVWDSFIFQKIKKTPISILITNNDANTNL